MAQHVKIFERLMYGSLILGLLTCLTEDYSAGEIAGLIAVIAVAAGLVWLAARKGSRLSVALLGVLTGFAILILIADVSGGSIPWLSAFASDPVPSKATLIIDAISVALMAAAMAFYFFGDRLAPQP